MDNYQFGKLKTKRKNRIKKAVTKKPEQNGVCRFISFKDIEHPKVNGHFTNHPIFTIRQGLQIEHIFYYVESGELKRAMINKHGAKILKVYDEIPEWADDLLIEKQKKFLSQ